VRIGYQGDTETDVEEMDAALHRWVEALPGAPAEVAHSDGGLVFTSCDPGAEADVGTGSSQEALELALTRTYVAIGLLSNGASDDQARCIADALVHRYTTQQLNDPELGLDPEFQADLRRLAAPCR
jgi:hypothetical protein